MLINLVILFSYKRRGPHFNDRLKDPRLFEKMSVSGTETFIAVLAILLIVSIGIEFLAFLFKCMSAMYNKTKAECGDSMRTSKSKFCFLFIKNLFLSKELYYHLIILALGILGVTLHPFFFAFHLINVVLRNEKLKDVLQAFLGPLAEIILTFLFFFILVYVFAVMGYTFYADMYPTYTCYSLFSCFIITLDQCFKRNGGYGAFLDDVYTMEDETESATFNVGRVIFDQASNFILLILIAQILAGLIIDKFGELRENAENMEEDIKSNCIVCGEKSDVIERKTGETFEQHKEERHNIWQYLLYIGYLRAKPKEEYNILQETIYKLFKKRSIAWLPYSLWEGKDEAIDSEDINKKLDEIKGTLEEQVNKQHNDK